MIPLKNLPESMQIQLLQEMLDGSEVAALVTDPNQEDHPIIFANKTFEALTGYPMSETLGRNCRFLQGEDTDPVAVNKIRTAIHDKQPVVVTMKNYKKDGTMFWNRLFIKPLEVEDKLYFIGTQTNVTLEHKQKRFITEKEKEIEQLILPILMLHNGVAAVSLIGKMTEERINLLSIGLSEFVQKSHIDYMIIDITGIRWDEETPLTTFQSVHSVLQLMGTELFITGVTPQIAQALTAMGESTERLLTFATIQQALERITKNT